MILVHPAIVMNLPNTAPECTHLYKIAVAIAVAVAV